MRILRGIARPEILRMSELNDSSELQKYSSAVLYVFSAVNAPQDEIDIILGHFLNAIKSSDVSLVLQLLATVILTKYSKSWRVRLNALPTLLVFFYRNLMNLPSGVVLRMMDVLLDCLADENVEVSEMASQMLSGVVRCSQRQSIIPLRVSLLSSDPFSILLTTVIGSLHSTGPQNQIATET